MPRGVRKNRTVEEEALFALDKELTKELEDMLPEVLDRTKYILDFPITSVQSLHGKIGGKNNEYANVADTRFHDYREFQRTWAKGMIERINASGYGAAVYDIAKLYKDDLCRLYILKFQERNFYREYYNRIRQKPDSQLWRIWFGNQLVLGLFIAPEQLPDGSWRIDHSEVRRAPYNYWTIGHILHVGGFVNPANNRLYPMRSYQDIEIFYLHIVTTLSNSQYEQAICQRYIQYLKQSTDVLSEPFLIPEFHYEGPEKRCRYRMDFTVLNPYTFDFVCFELSPSSTHFKLKREDFKTQAEFNIKIAERWKYEFDKRNAYLSQYNLSCYTFTDEQLQDPDCCFSIIASCLSKRATSAPSMDDVLSYLNTLEL